MKKFVSLCIGVFLIVFLTIPAFAEALPRVVDDSFLLKTEERMELENTIAELRDKYHFDVVILAVDSLGGKTATAYADDFYDNNGYGYNENKDGVLFLVCTGKPAWAISTRGFGITAITDYGTDYLANNFVPLLSDGNYAEAFRVFLSDTDTLLEKAADGTPYDVNNQVKSSSHNTIRILVALGFAAVGAFIIVMILKQQMNSAVPQHYARSYVRNFNLRIQNDIFLFSTSTRVRRESNSGGSSTHIGSSGASHGGSSGEF
ncbi:MAG: TPM domain-containing protein [Oscillospiraceae bacterium]